MTHQEFWSPRQYIESSSLKGIKYKILEFNPVVLRGKVKPDSSRPDLLHPVSPGGDPQSSACTQSQIFISLFPYVPL